MPRPRTANKPPEITTTVTQTFPSTDPRGKPEGTTTTQDFWEAVSETTEKSLWDERCCYVYRDDPPTRGYRGNIHVFREDFSIETITDMFGGYEYKLMLVQRKTGRMVAALNKLYIAAPPKAPGIADPGMLSANGMQMTPAPATDAAQIIATVTQFFNKRLDDERKNAANDPAQIAAINLVQKSADAAIQNAYNQTQNNRQQNPAIEQMLMVMMNGFTGFMAKIMDRSMAPPGTDMFGGLDKVLGLVERLGGKIGGGGGTSEPFLEIGRSLIQAAPEIIGQGMGKYVDIQRMRTRQMELQVSALALQRGVAPPIDVQPAAAGATPNPQPFVVPTRPAAPGPGAVNAGMNVVPFGAEISPQPPAAPAPPSAAANGGAPDPDWIKARLVQLIQQGFSGESLIDWLSGTDPKLVFDLRSADDNMVRAFFAADPVLATALQLPNFDQVLHEAIAYMRGSAPEPGFTN